MKDLFGKKTAEEENLPEMDSASERADSLFEKAPEGESPEDQIIRISERRIVREFEAEVKQER